MAYPPNPKSNYFLMTTSIMKANLISLNLSHLLYNFDLNTILLILGLWSKELWRACCQLASVNSLMGIHSVVFSQHFISNFAIVGKFWLLWNVGLASFRAFYLYNYKCTGVIEKVFKVNCMLSHLVKIGYLSMLHINRQRF